jgi:alpha-glucosidase
MMSQKAPNREKDTPMKICYNPERRSWLCTAAFVLLALVAGPRHAPAAQLQVSSNAPYMCAAVSGGEIANGTPVIAYSCAAAFGQQWNYVGGQFEGIGTTGSKSMCLDVEGNKTTAGTLVDLYECNGGQNQQWQVITTATTGTTVIFGVQSSMCLDSSGGPATGGGTQLIINTCNYGSSQTWIMRRMEFQVNTGAPHKCAAVEGSKTASGTPVIAYSCSGGFNDEWNLSGGQIRGIGTVNGTSMCLTAAGTASGSLVELSTCSSTSSTQKWWLFSGASLDCPSCTLIYLMKTGNCLDSSGGPSTGGGTQLVITDCTATASENWIVR